MGYIFYTSKNLYRFRVSEIGVQTIILYVREIYTELNDKNFDITF